METRTRPYGTEILETRVPLGGIFAPKKNKNQTIKDKYEAHFPLPTKSPIYIIVAGAWDSLIHEKSIAKK